MNPSKPIGRVLIWRGGSSRNSIYGTHLTIRSYEELPTSSTYPEYPQSVWEEGPPVYGEPQAAEDKLSTVVALAPTYLRDAVYAYLEAEAALNAATKPTGFGGMGAPKAGASEQYRLAAIYRAKKAELMALLEATATKPTEE